jgi:hypothetical protein
MTLSLVKKIPGGYQVDGLDLLRGNCERTTGLWPAAGNGYPQTYSIVKREGDVVAFFAKAITSNTKDKYEWGYRVKKGSTEVDVLVYDTRTPKTFIFRGEYPPPVSAWQARGWEVLDQFERPLGGRNCLNEVRHRMPMPLAG